MPIKKKLSDWLRNEKRRVDKDVGELLDGFAELRQELAKEGVKGKTIKRDTTTIPGQVWRTRDRHTHCLRISYRSSKNT